MHLTKLLESEGKVLFDGGTGTLLEEMGAPAGGAACVEAPDAVEKVGRMYADAGSKCIVTNTFCMNRIYMDKHCAELDVKEVNTRGVEIVRKAAGDRAAVLGDIGPTGEMLSPLGTGTEESFYAAFLEQAATLAAAGIDGFIIETMIDLNEALTAVRACRENFDLPVIATMTYATETKGGRTQMGDRAADCAAALEAAGCAAVGMNCGDLTPEQMAVVVAEYKAACSIPILAQPNAGMPRLDGDNTVFDMSPVDFAAGTIKCATAGAKLLGGCCGTTPDHIKALGDALRSLQS